MINLRSLKGPSFVEIALSKKEETRMKRKRLVVAALALTSAFGVLCWSPIKREPKEGVTDN